MVDPLIPIGFGTSRIEKCWFPNVLKVREMKMLYFLRFCNLENWKVCISLCFEGSRFEKVVFPQVLQHLYFFVTCTIARFHYNSCRFLIFLKINENCRKSMQIKTNLWKSTQIDENQRKSKQSMKIYEILENQWQSMKIVENLWKAMKIYENPRKSTKIDEKHWTSLKIHENHRKSCLLEGIWN